MLKVLEKIALIYVMDVLPVKSLDTFGDKEPVMVCSKKNQDWPSFVYVKTLSVV